MHNGRYLPSLLIGGDEPGTQMSRARTLLSKLTSPNRLAQPVDSHDRHTLRLDAGWKVTSLVRTTKIKIPIFTIGILMYHASYG